MQTKKAEGVSVDEIVDFYWRFLSRNANYAVHFGQFKTWYQLLVAADPLHILAER